MVKKSNCTPDELIKKGYRDIGRMPTQIDNVVTNFQKKVTDDKGIKYFINVTQYNNTDLILHSLKYAKDTNLPKYSFEFDSQLYQGISHNAFNVHLLSDWTLDDAEQLIDNIWEMQDLDYYEEY